jgi:dTDP-4-dehydrorhamnose 3,5-epimerase|tara:strand:- start:409 stop:861 length:453 start_codon:yes stop_codon:yes gene_type:complete
LNTSYSVNLEVHDTKDAKSEHVNGSLTVIWRDWDTLLKNDPKMVYVSSVNPGELKGPHLHTKRTSYFTCVHGKVVFIIREKNGNYVEIESSEKNPVMVIVPKNIASAHINLSDNVSRVLTLADVSWKPNDNEMENVTFDDYEWKKWNISN